MKTSKIIALAAFMAIGATTANAQIKIVDDSIPPMKTEANNPDKIFVAVEQAPTYPGGDAELYKKIAHSIHYPENAVKENIQGRVTVQFVVEKDGSVGEVKVVRGKDPDLDKEAIRVIKSMPKFIPGKMNGETVRCWYTLPINFHLKTK